MHGCQSRRLLNPPTGTIKFFSSWNEKMEMSNVTTTSGLAWKLPAECGDSQIIGAGCSNDQDIVDAAATQGSGEEDIKVCGAHTVGGKHATWNVTGRKTGMDVLKRYSPQLHL